ncbi:MAG: hypothetical protein Q8K72_10305, partial [Acidimicrobiales bacterium]|nr:hypothetical protein [Acidimicrobiales bacterium]
LQTDSGDDTAGNVHPLVVVPVPVNPAPNTVISGHIHVNGAQDNFEFIFNEQIVNPDGSITVRAAHQRFLGPTAVGDLILGEVVCGVTTALAPTTTSSTTTTLPPTTTTLPPTTTTLPPTTTTTLPPTTTTTTLPPATTTLPPTTTTLPPTTTTTTPPASGTCSQLQAQKAAFNAQITAIEASLAQTLSGAQLAATIAQLEATRAAGNAQYDAAIAACNGTPPTTTSSTTTTVTTVPPPTTTTTIAPPPSNAEVCAVLLPLAANPFFAPFIQQLLIQYGCLT